MKLNKFAFLAIALIFSLNACKKDNTPEQPEEPKDQVINEWVTVDTKGIVNVKDLKVVGGRNVYALFSLDKMGFVSQDKVKTDEWDLSFTETNGALIQSNLGTTVNVDAPYYEGKGTVAMAFTGKAFDDVTAPPAAGDFDQSGELGLYIKSNIESEHEMHWAKWIYKENGFPSYVMPLKNKTIVLKLTDGRYAKLEYQSYYKGGLLTPTEADYLKGELGYANFRYYVSKKGSTDLTTK